MITLKSALGKDKTAVTVVTLPAQKLLKARTVYLPSWPVFFTQSCCPRAKPCATLVYTLSSTALTHRSVQQHTIVLWRMQAAQMM